MSAENKKMVCCFNITITENKPNLNLKNSLKVFKNDYYFEVNFFCFG